MGSWMKTNAPAYQKGLLLLLFSPFSISLAPSTGVAAAAATTKG
jgi:hypothetical protein